MYLDKRRDYFYKHSPTSGGMEWHGGLYRRDCRDAATAAAAAAAAAMHREQQGPLAWLRAELGVTVAPATAEEVPKHAGGWLNGDWPADNARVPPAGVPPTAPAPKRHRHRHRRRSKQKDGSTTSEPADGAQAQQAKQPAPTASAPEEVLSLAPAAAEEAAKQTDGWLDDDELLRRQRRGIGLAQGAQATPRAAPTWTPTITRANATVIGER